jgi:hypothetical protein
MFPDDHYEEFPEYEDLPEDQKSEDDGPIEGFNTYVRLNDPNLFTEAARADPVIDAFLNAPFSVTFAKFKSSTRQSEWAVHKPHLAMAGQVDGIHGRVDGFPEDPADARIGTFIVNHENTLAVRKLFTVVLEDGLQCGQMIYKQGDRPAADGIVLEPPSEEAQSA